MATAFQGLSVAPKRDRLFAYKCNTAGMLEGAAFVVDASAAGQSVKAPTGAAVTGFQGLLADVTPASGTAILDDINLQRDGIGLGLLKAGQSVVAGQRLVIAGVDGSLRVYNDGVDVNCDIVGTAEQTATAPGGSNLAIAVNLDKGSTVP